MFNRKLLATAAAASLVMLGSSNAFAASATGTANATIVAPLSISETTEMSFGDISPDADTATTVQLDDAGNVSSPDGAGLAGGTVDSGLFTVSGFGALTFDITLPANGVVTLTGPGPAMAVDNFVDSGGGSGTLAAGIATFTVGADLSVGANQTAGAYSGSYTVTVNYN
jgi:hypothetical protein